MLFPEKLISDGLGGSFGNANKFTSTTPYSVRRPLQFGSPDHVKGLEDIFLKDKEAIHSNEKRRVRIKLRKKGTQDGNLDLSVGVSSQNLNKGSSEDKNVDINLYQLDPNYRSTIGRNDYLSQFMFPVKTEETKPNVNISESPKIVEETREKSLLGPWCKKDLDLKLLDESNQETSRKSQKSLDKETTYVDPFIIEKVRSVNANPRFQWYVPDTEIYHPVQAILWPGPLLQSQLVFEEKPIEQPIEEQPVEETVEEAQDEDFHSAEPFEMRKSVSYVNRKPVQALIITEVGENFSR